MIAAVIRWSLANKTKKRLASDQRMTAAIMAAAPCVESAQ